MAEGGLGVTDEIAWHNELSALRHVRQFAWRPVETGYDMPADVPGADLIQRQPPSRVAPAGEIGLAFKPNGVAGEVELGWRHRQNSASCSQDCTILPRSPALSVSAPGDQPSAMMKGLSLAIEWQSRPTSSSRSRR